ncbi:MAG: WYL domain-containing protein [Paludibacteraceae bacterium]|nr:WYL domain-containing protein [Paludibacteraceae bacterium]
MAKNLLEKYVWLVNTIYDAGYITFKEINNKWREADFDGKDLPLRTFHDWRNAIEEMFGLIIECEKNGRYRYYIKNRDEIDNGGFRNWLLKTVSVSSLLVENLKIKNRILLEDIPSGVNFLSLIIDAMKSNSVLKLTYRGFNADKPYSFNVHPYCVKLFKQRWYLVAYDTDYHTLRTYSLDRILNCEKLEDSFVLPIWFNAESYFKNTFGVNGVDKEPEEVKIRVKYDLANYLRTLPIHSSQKELGKKGGYVEFSYYVVPTIELIQEFRRYGSDLEILAPESLRNKFRDDASSLSDTYSSGQSQSYYEPQRNLGFNQLGFISQGSFGFIVNTNNSPNPNSNNESRKDSDLDPLFYEVASRLVFWKVASNRMLQFHFAIGHGRAHCLLDQLESLGIVGPDNGGRREVLVSTLEELDDKIYGASRNGKLTNYLL